MKNFLIIFIGGGVGSWCRYLITNHLNTNFPYGTLLVNLLGCFLLGLVMGLIIKFDWNKDIFLLLVVGFCGGFTTFSSFVNEKYILFKSGQILNIFIYGGLSILLGFLCVAIGYWIATKL